MDLVCFSIGAQAALEVGSILNNQVGQTHFFHRSDVSIGHGVEDNWSPFPMASYLDNAIPAATNIESMEGLSHYSCTACQCRRERKPGKPKLMAGA